VVPHYKQRGDNATLLCRYSQGSKHLYSLKWYKDEVEFYRYQPWNLKDQQQIFDVPGIKVDLADSKPSRIVLRKVNFRSSGIYRCEITSINFEIYEKYEQMTVIELPKKAPTITTSNLHGINQYEIGDMLQLNCTSDPSNPAAELKWEINKELVPEQHYIFNEKIQHGRRLWITRIGLQIVLNHSHYNWGKLKVACVGEIKAVFWARGVENIYMETPVETYKVLKSSEGYWIANSGGKPTDLLYTIAGLTVIIKYF